MKYQPFLNEKSSSFLELYPTVKSLKLITKETGDVMYPAQSVYTYNEQNITPNKSCSNPKCQKGGYNLQSILFYATENKKKNHIGIFNCNGFESQPEDICFNSIEYEIEIFYK